MTSTHDALDLTVLAPSPNPTPLDITHGTPPPGPGWLLVTSGGHHWTPVQTCSFKDPRRVTSGGGH